MVYEWPSSFASDMACVASRLLSYPVSLKTCDPGEDGGRGYAWILPEAQEKSTVLITSEQAQGEFQLTLTLREVAEQRETKPQYAPCSHLLRGVCGTLRKRNELLRDGLSLGGVAHGSCC